MSDISNGELVELLKVKREYRAKVVSLEAELKARYDRELAEGKKNLREQYLGEIVDLVFAEPAPTPALVPVEEPKPEPAPASVVEAKPEPVAEIKQPGVCPECEAKVEADARFCSQCAFPLKEEVKQDEPQTVASAGRRFSVRVR